MNQFDYSIIFLRKRLDDVQNSLLGLKESIPGCEVKFDLLPTEIKKSVIELESIREDLKKSINILYKAKTIDRMVMDTLILPYSGEKLKNINKTLIPIINVLRHDIVEKGLSDEEILKIIKACREEIEEEM